MFRLIKHQVAPNWPAEVRGIIGSVAAKIVVAENGNVAEVVAVNSNDPLLNQPNVQEAVRQALRQRRYQPKTQNGQPVRFTGEVIVNLAGARVISERELLSRIRVRNSLWPEEVATIAGTVAIRVEVGEDGSVRAARAGSRHPVLSARGVLNEIERRVLGWRFAPFTHNGAPGGRPIRVTSDITLANQPR